MPLQKKPVSNEVHLEFSVYVITILISCILIITGIWLSYTYSKHELLLVSKIIPVFISELGVAGLVAIILIATIEKFNAIRHKNHTQETIDLIQNNFFKAIFSRYIPEKVFGEVEECLFNAKVVRADYLIEYRLMEIDESLESYNKEIKDLPASLKSEYLFCEINTSYTLRNITNKTITHLIESYIELPLDEEMKKMVSFDRLIINKEQTSPSILKDHVSSSHAHLILKHQVTIPPGSEIHVETDAKTMKRNLDMEVLASRLPSEGMTISVRSPVGVQVQSYANHSCELDVNESAGGQHVTLKLPHGIFPFQSIIFWWNGRKEKTKSIY